MDKRSVLIAALVAAAAFSLGAQAAKVSYVEGTVSRSAGASWKAVALGDELAPDAVLRLAGSSFLELKAQGATLSLSQPGSYSLRDLLAAGRASRSSGISAVLAKFRAAFSAEDLTTRATTAGVRGAEQGRDEGADWVSSGAEVYLAAAKDYIASGDYPAAIRQLQRALDTETGDKAELEYYLADAESLGGNAREAFLHLSKLSPSGSEAWAPDYSLLKAELLIGSFAPRAAVDLLVAARASLADDARRAPLYYFLLALGYRNLGDTVNERSCVDRLTSIAGDGELAKAAEGLDRNP